MVSGRRPVGRPGRRLSEVGQRAGNRSSFDARNYGFARLADLIDTLPNFATEKRAGGAVYVKRVR